MVLPMTNMLFFWCVYSDSIEERHAYLGMTKACPIVCNSPDIVCLSLGEEEEEGI